MYKWRKFKHSQKWSSSKNIKRPASKKRHRIFWEIIQNPRVTSGDLHASLTLTNVNVYESTIRQTRNISASLKFPKDDIDELENTEILLSGWRREK